MNPLAELLGGEPSELGRLARAALVGLRATLAHGLAHADPADPQRNAILAVLGYLDNLFSPTSDKDTPTEPAPAPPVPPVELSWPGLLAEWQARPEGHALGKIAADAADLPGRLWLFTWRLPPAVVEEFRDRWRAVAGPGAETPAPADALDPRLGVAPSTPLARRIASALSRLLWFADNDPSLSHMLRGVYRFGLIGLNAVQRDRYIQALVNRCDRLRRAEEAGDAREVLTAWVDVDEAAHSLTYQPPPHPQSEFAQIARVVRESLPEVRDLAARANLSFHLQCPSGRYADLKGLTDPDADVPVDTGAAPGDVVLCARVFLRLDDVKHPGRVIYRTR